MDAPRTSRFGGLVLNAERGCLEDATGAERFLRPKSFRVLELLAARLGRLVAKDDLVREAWPDVIVSDDSLAQCVSDIRRALGPEGAGLLRTVPRRGYMLMAEVPGAAPSGDAARQLVQGRTGGRAAEGRASGNGASGSLAAVVLAGGLALAAGGA